MQLRIEPRHFLLALTLLALWLAWLVVRPFAGVLFMAAVVATVAGGLVTRLSARVGGRGRAAALVTLGLLVALVGPLAGITAGVVGQAAGALDWLTRAAQRDGMRDLVTRLPEVFRPLALGLVERIPHGAREVEEALQQALDAGAVSTVGGILQATGTALSSLLLFFVALFFLLSDGPRLVEWLKENLPLPRGKSAVLLGYLGTVTRSVVISTLATSGVQASLALVGYLLAGVPSAVFFALVTFFTSFIPAVGTMLVWLPLALLKLGGGHTGAAVFLVAWGLLVVGMADNLVKPVLIRRGVAFPVGLVFFALLGGLAAFGPVGLVAGPLALAFLVATIRAWHEW
ncbi:MAG TPA: AI-2E family transporter [Anaeromyxobacteraceae bacterium]|nr:AI-2E family transporter [Anaeromyxobacteraceae bacterium]